MYLRAPLHTEQQRQSNRDRPGFCVAWVAPSAVQRRHHEVLCHGQRLECLVAGVHVCAGRIVCRCAFVYALHVVVCPL
eukprot:42642-Rhodomonas_salina.1